MIKQTTLALGLLLVAGICRAQFVDYQAAEIPRDGMQASTVNALLHKIDDYQTGRLNSYYGNPQWQAKISTLAYSQVVELNQRTINPLKGDLLALQMLAWVNDDAGSYATQPAPLLNATLSYSPRFNVARLSWNNARQENVYCYKYATALPGGGISQETFRLSEEASYRIYRNGRLITTINGAIATAKDQNISAPPINFGFIKLKLKGSIQGNPELQSTSTEPVFYDVEPYQGVIGTPVRYKIEVWFKGCGAIENTVPTAGSLVSSGDIWLDNDGDSYPDFYPVQEVAAKRAENPANIDYGALLGNFSYTSYNNMNGGGPIPGSDIWEKFLRELDNAIKARIGRGIDAVADIRDAVVTCRMQMAPCHVRKASVQGVSDQNGRPVWTLTYTP